MTKIKVSKTVLSIGICDKTDINFISYMCLHNTFSVAGLAVLVNI